MKLRAAFSLIELLIVIMIIGLVYTLALGGFKKMEEEQESVTLANLREFLSKIPHARSVRFLCLDECESCTVLADDVIVEDLKGVFDGFIDDSIVSYTYDYNLGLDEVTYEPYFNVEDVQESVCFSYRVFKNGVGEQVFISYKNRVYDYTTYLEKTKVYGSLQELRDEKERLIQEVMQ